MSSAVIKEFVWPLMEKNNRHQIVSLILTYVLGRPRANISAPLAHLFAHLLITHNEWLKRWAANCSGPVHPLLWTHYSRRLYTLLLFHLLFPAALWRDLSFRVERITSWFQKTPYHESGTWSALLGVVNTDWQWLSRVSSQDLSQAKVWSQELLHKPGWYASHKQKD